MQKVTPVDPVVSIYPQPMSARRARFEGKRARRQGIKLPIGHPYRSLPLWLPYFIAIRLARSYQT